MFYCTHKHTQSEYNSYNVYIFQAFQWPDFCTGVCSRVCARGSVYFSALTLSTLSRAHTHTLKLYFSNSGHPIWTRSRHFTQQPQSSNHEIKIIVLNVCVYWGTRALICICRWMACACVRACVCMYVCICSVIDLPISSSDLSSSNIYIVRCLCVHGAAAAVIGSN